MYCEHFDFQEYYSSRVQPNKLNILLEMPQQMLQLAACKYYVYAALTPRYTQKIC